MKPLQGQLLLASPDLRDPNFFHTVVLLVRHNEEGALGLILNRPLSIRLHDVWNQIGAGVPRRNDVIHFGGPCEGPLMALHDEPAWGETEAVSGVNFCTSRELLEQLVNDSTRQARFFAGFAGWSAGQLEGEMSEGSWHVTAATADVVYAAEADLWETLTRSLSGKQILDALHIRHVPPDLRMN